MPYTLIAHKLYKTFTYPTPVEVLKGVSLQVAPGASLAIIGASGEGKSTLLHTLGTLELPTQGYLEIGGRDTSQTPNYLLRQQGIGFIFQHFYLLEDLTVIDNVLMPARIARQAVDKGSLAYQRAERLLDQVGLSHRTFFPTKLLSGGEKQRVGIARALCNDPLLILADEPTGNLDHATSQAIYQLLIACCKQQHKSLVIATHDKELAKLCDVIYQLQDGHLHPLSIDF